MACLDLGWPKWLRAGELEGLRRWLMIGPRDGDTARRFRWLLLYGSNRSSHVDDLRLDDLVTMGASSGEEGDDIIEALL